jgi:hypothetical protein
MLLQKIQESRVKSDCDCDCHEQEETGQRTVCR